MRLRSGLWSLAVAAALYLAAAPAEAGAGPEAALADEPAALEAPPKKAPRRSKSKDAPGAAAANIATPPMWRIADDDTEIILLGTFHILPPDVQWRSPELGRAIDAADEIWFEAEVDTPSAQAETLRILKTEGFLKKGAKLSTLLEADDATRLEGIATSLDVPFAAVDVMRPWQAFLVLSVELIKSKGFDPSAGLENRLLSEGRARGRNFVFLESVPEQLGFFTKLQPDVEKSLLTLTVRDWEKQTEEFDKLFIAWKAGDADAIDALMNQTMREETPEVYKVLVVDRNKAWTARIRQALDSPGRKLIAVGAAHLVGADGVPAMLEADGVLAPRYGLAANDNDAPADAGLKKREKKKKEKAASSDEPAPDGTDETVNQPLELSDPAEHEAPAAASGPDGPPPADEVPDPS